MTTAAVVAYHRPEGRVKISYAGHPPVFHKKAADKTWSYIKPAKRKDQSGGFPINLPLATDIDTHYAEVAISTGPGDRFFVYTDGITDALNSSGQPFRLKRLKNVLDENSEVPLADLKSSVLKRLNRYTDKEIDHDDITLIALEIL